MLPVYGGFIVFRIAELADQLIDAGINLARLALIERELIKLPPRHPASSRGRLPATKKEVSIYNLG